MSVNNFVILKLNNDGFNKLALLDAVFKTISLHWARQQNRKRISAIVFKGVAFNRHTFHRQDQF